MELVSLPRQQTSSVARSIGSSVLKTSLGNKSAPFVTKTASTFASDSDKPGLVPTHRSIHDQRQTVLLTDAPHSQRISVLLLLLLQVGISHKLELSSELEQPNALRLAAVCEHAQKTILIYHAVRDVDVLFLTNSVKQEGRKSL